MGTAKIYDGRRVPVFACCDGDNGIPGNFISERSIVRNPSDPYIRATSIEAAREVKP